VQKAAAAPINVSSDSTRYAAFRLRARGRADVLLRTGVLFLASGAVRRAAALRPFPFTLCRSASMRSITLERSSLSSGGTV